MCTEVGKDDSVSSQMSNIFPQMINIFPQMSNIFPQMINIACQNVTEGTDSFDFCEVIPQNWDERDI